MRRVAVVVWNAASDHRQVVVSPGSYAEVEINYDTGIR